MIDVALLCGADIIESMCRASRFLLPVVLAGCVWAFVVSCASSRRHEQQTGAVPPTEAGVSAPPVEPARRITVAARVVEVKPTGKVHQSYIFVVAPENVSRADESAARYVFELYQDFGGGRLLAALGVDARRRGDSRLWTSERGDSLIDLELAVEGPPSAVVTSGLRSLSTPNAHALAWCVECGEWQRAGWAP